MKGCTRYYRDLEFKAEVDEQFRLAKEATRPGYWITYAIHDPSKFDHVERRENGLIRYMGRSKQFGKRVPKRMASAGRATGRPTDHIDCILYDIMNHGGPAPRWSIIEEVTTVIDSMVSEANWTVELRRRGYPLVVNAREHKNLTEKIDRYQVDRERLWEITADDAIGSNVEVFLHDPVSGRELPVDLTTKLPNKRLQSIRAEARTLGIQARLLIR